MSSSATVDNSYDSLNQTRRVVDYSKKMANAEENMRQGKPYEAAKSNWHAAQIADLLRNDQLKNAAIKLAYKRLMTVKKNSLEGAMIRGKKVELYMVFEFAAVIAEQNENALGPGSKTNAANKAATLLFRKIRSYGKNLDQVQRGEITKLSKMVEHFKVDEKLHQRINAFTYDYLLRGKPGYSSILRQIEFGAELYTTVT